MLSKKQQEFLEIAKGLNQIGIVPLLMGSLGLELVTGRDWQAGDIDIHVHGDERGWEAPDEERIFDFDKIQCLMKDLGYLLVDLHEHEFQKGDLSVEFAAMETLESFSGVPISELSKQDIDGISFLLPTPQQFLAIYQASSKDSYRNENNNNKDFAKIEYLENHMNEI